MGRAAEEESHRLRTFEGQVLSLSLISFSIVAGFASLRGLVTFSGYETPLFVRAAPAVLLVDLALLAWRGGQVRLRSWAFLAVAQAWVLTMVLGHGWVPPYVLAVAVVANLAGLLLGAHATYAVVAANFIALLSMRLRGVPDALPRAVMDPHDPANWNRLAVGYFLLSGVLMLALDRAIRQMAPLHADAKANLRSAKAESAEAEAMHEARRALERDLRRAQRLKTVRHIAAGLSALYGRCLTVVMAAIEELEFARSDADVREAARIIREAALRAARPTRELLDFGRSTSHSMDTVEVATFVREIAPRLERTLGEDVALKIEAKGSAEVFLQPGRFVEVLLELALNAQAALRGRGSVELRVDEVVVDRPIVGLELSPGPYARITLEDEGCGMSEEVLSRALEPFFTTKTSRGAHDGLGLTSAFAFARAAKGTLRIRSTLGKGTRVELYLAARDALEQLPTLELSAPDLQMPEAAPSPKSPRLARGWQPADWQVRAVDALLGWLWWIFLAGFVSILALARPEMRLPGSIGLGTALLLLTLVRRQPSLPYGLRVAALVAPIAAIGFGFVLVNSYLNAPPLALVPLVAALLLVLMPRVYGWVAHVVSSLFFVVAGSLHSMDWMVPPLVGFSMDDGGNQLRVAVMLSLSLLVFSRAVQSVVEYAKEAVDELEASLAAVSEASQARAKQTQELVLVEGMRARAATMDVTGKLAEAVAHDMNNALQVLVGWADEVTHDPSDVELRADALDSLHQAMSAAVTLLLDLRPRHGARLHPTPCDLGGTVCRVAKLVTAVLRDGIEVKIEAEPGRFAAISEADLRRVLLNLTNNAGHAMPEGGQLTVRVGAAADEETVWVEVEDTGHGMDAATRAQAFDDFFTTKALGEGTGLGLGSVRRIVEGSGGTIELESAAGVGTKFTLRWPRAEPTTKSAVKQVAGAPLSGRTVLVADPDPHVCRMMQRALAEAGCAVAVAQAGDEAASTIETTDDLSAVCIDERLVWDRPDLLRGLSERHPATAVFVACTDLEASTTQDLGVDVIPVTKPFSGHELRREVALRLNGPA